MFHLNTSNYYNTIQVFGLCFSGTNFVEWTIANNFVDIKYNNINCIHTNGSLKHTKPSLDYCKYAIIIYKHFKYWSESCAKYNKFHRPSRQYWDDYYKEFIEGTHNLDKNKIYVIEHSSFVKNYHEILVELANKFNLRLCENIVQPTHRLDKGGANVRQTKDIYRHYD